MGVFLGFGARILGHARIVVETDEARQLCHEAVA
jgi:hypothetical protein